MQLHTHKKQKAKKPKSQGHSRFRIDPVLFTASVRPRSAKSLIKIKKDLQLTPGAQQKNTARFHLLWVASPPSILISL